MPDSMTPRTVARQVPLSIDFPGKNTGVGFHSLLQGIFPTQGANLGLPHCRQILYHLSYREEPKNPPSNAGDLSKRHQFNAWVGKSQGEVTVGKSMGSQTVGHD